MTIPHERGVFKQSAAAWKRERGARGAVGTRVQRREEGSEMARSVWSGRTSVRHFIAGGWPRRTREAAGPHLGHTCPFDVQGGMTPRPALALRRETAQRPTQTLVGSEREQREPKACTSCYMLTFARRRRRRRRGGDSLQWRRHCPRRRSLLRGRQGWAHACRRGRRRVKRCIHAVCR